MLTLIEKICENFLRLSSKHNRYYLILTKRSFSDSSSDGESKDQNYNYFVLYEDYSKLDKYELMRVRINLCFDLLKRGNNPLIKEDDLLYKLDVIENIINDRQLRYTKEDESFYLTLPSELPSHLLLKYDSISQKKGVIVAYHYLDYYCRFKKFDDRNLMHIKKVFENISIYSTNPESREVSRFYIEIINDLILEKKK
jgi:hypothetical protein